MTRPAELDHERRPAGPMAAAEFMVTREFLGLSAEWLAQNLVARGRHLSVRTVQRWEAGDTVIPDEIHQQMQTFQAKTLQVVHDAIAVCELTPDPSVLTYHSERDYLTHQPGGRWSARWHRAVVARLAQEVPRLEIGYWTPDHVDPEPITGVTVTYPLRPWF